MSTPIAKAAINTLLQYGNGASPEVFTTIPNMGSISGPPIARVVQDVTSHSAAVPWRERFPTLLDGGDITFDIFYIPNDATHQAVLALLLNVASPIVDWRLTFPNSIAVTGNVNFFFTGFLSKMTFVEKVDDVIRASCTLAVTGQIVANYP